MLKNKERKLNNISKLIVKNILIAVVIILYLFFLNLGFIKIENQRFLIDLKFFTLCALIITIFLFELSYKKKDINICINSIELLVLSISSLLYIYIFNIYQDKFSIIIIITAIAFFIYYIIKIIIMYVKKKKDYVDSLNDIKNILDKNIKDKEVKPIRKLKIDENNEINSKTIKDNKEKTVKSSNKQNKNKTTKQNKNTSKKSNKNNK